MKKKYRNISAFLNNIVAVVLLFIYKATKKLRKHLRHLPSLQSLPFLGVLVSKVSPIISRPFSRLGSMPRSRANIIVFLGVVILLIGGAALYFFAPGIGQLGGGDKDDSKKEVDVLSAVKKAKLVGTAGLGETIMMGNLEITLYNTKEGSYNTFERDLNNNRISKTFFGANMKVFNTASGPGLENNEVVYALLEDDLGRKYERDREIEFMLGNIKDFGPDKNVWPRTIREGYLLFPGPAKEAKKLVLTIYSDARKEKVVFELTR